MSYYDASHGYYDESDGYYVGTPEACQRAQGRRLLADPDRDAMLKELRETGQFNTRRFRHAKGREE